MSTDKYCDYVNIQRFDPPTEHLGGKGTAGPLFEKPLSEKKEFDER